MPLIEGIRHRWPDFTLLLTTQTSTGAAMARRLCPDVPHRSAPLDLPWVAARAVAQVRPRVLVLEYLELWPRQVAACARKGVPVMVVDGRVSQKSLRWRWLLKTTARRVSCFCGRSDGDRARAVQLGVSPSKAFVCGNGKYDALRVAPQPEESLRAALGNPDVVVGSLHPDEFEAAMSALAGSSLRGVIAPRYPADSARIMALGAHHGVSCALRSEGPAPLADWIVLDTMGELAAAYGLASVAIVGGTFGRRGGQNLVEPAAHGVPVVHGPNVANITEEAEALAGAGATEVPHWRAAVELAAVRCVDPGPDPRAALSALTGATAAHLDHLARLLASPQLPAA